MADAPAEPALKLPSAGELLPASEKRFKETVVLVPFYGGGKQQLHAHSEMLCQAGYDVVLFDMHWIEKKLNQSYFSSRQEFGMKHIWADQIEGILNAIPGRKIVYAFSSPSASAIEAIARRHATDIRGLVLDSGPSGNLLASTANYFAFQEPIRPTPLRWGMAAAMTLVWSPDFRTTIADDMQALPEGFKILSIRGWKDRIMSTHDIDLVFEPHKNIDWRKLSLPQGAHCNGLKDFHDEYVGPVLSFLKSISQETGHE